MSFARALIGAATLAFGLAGPALAYPERTITVVVPFAAGGTTDVVARIFADHMSIGLYPNLTDDPRSAFKPIIKKAGVTAN